MIRWLLRSLIKTLYRWRIVQSRFVSADTLAHYKHIRPFCTLRVDTPEGAIHFSFKEDIRDAGRKPMFGLRSYVLEVDHVDQSVSQRAIFNNERMLVTGMFLGRPDRRVLVRVLVELYLDKLLIKYNRVSEAP